MSLGQNYSGQNTEKGTPNNHPWSWVPGMAQYHSGNKFHAVAGWLVIAACVAVSLWNLSPRFQYGFFGVKLLWETPEGAGALNLVFTLASLFLAAAVANKLLFDARDLATLPDTKFARWATLLLCPRRGLTPRDNTQSSMPTAKPSADSLLWTLAKLHFYAFTVIPLFPICLACAFFVPGLQGPILQMPHAITTAGFGWSANLLTAAGLLGVWLTVTVLSQLERSTATTGEQAADAGSTAQDAPHVTGKWRPVLLVSLGIASMCGLVRLVMSGGAWEPW